MLGNPNNHLLNLWLRYGGEADTTRHEVDWIILRNIPQIIIQSHLCINGYGGQVVVLKDRIIIVSSDNRARGKRWQRKCHVGPPVEVLSFKGCELLTGHWGSVGINVVFTTDGRLLQKIFRSQHEF
jgi:hypothetical protein